MSSATWAGVAPFCGAKTRAASTKPRPHVAGRDQLDAAEPPDAPDGPDRAEAAVGRGRATHADDDPLGPAVERGRDQLAGAVAGRGRWDRCRPRRPTRARPDASAISITAVPLRSRHGASTGSPSGPMTIVERVGPPSAASVPSPPSATGASSHSPPSAATPRADRGRDLGGRCRAAELVGGGDDAHGRRLRLALALRCRARGECRAIRPWRNAMRRARPEHDGRDRPGRPGPRRPGRRRPSWSTRRSTGSRRSTRRSTP